MRCNMDWSLVDYVLFPVFIPSKLLVQQTGHWCLAILSIKERCIFVYDSKRSGRHDRVVHGILESYAVLLPHFLRILGFFEKRSDIDFNSRPYSVSLPTDPFEIKSVDNLPIQTAW